MLEPQIRRMLLSSADEFIVTSDQAGPQGEDVVVKVEVEVKAKVTFRQGRAGQGRASSRVTLCLG